MPSLTERWPVRRLLSIRSAVHRDKATIGPSALLARQGEKP
jgi:hypothetical protein